MAKYLRKAKERLKKRREYHEEMTSKMTPARKAGFRPPGSMKTRGKFK